MSESFWNKTIRERTSRRRLLQAGGAFSIGAAALAVVGCGSDDGEDSGVTPEATTGATGNPVRGGKIGLTASSAPNFNPFVLYTEGTSLSGAYVYDRILTSHDDSRRYVLRGMEKVETPDPLTLTFTLKPGLKFENKAPVNGRNVTAEDVKLGEEYVRDIPNAYDSNFQRSYMDSVTAPDERTLVFKLKKPNAYIFGSQMLGLNTNHLFVPKEILASDLATTPPVGSGPYSLAEHQINTRYLFRRSDTYRDAAKGHPYIDEREVTIVSDAVAQEAQFRSGQTHSLTPPYSTFDRVSKEIQGARVYNITGIRQHALWLNMERDLPWQKDERIRKALWRLTNRQQFIDLAFGGNGVLPNGVIPAGLLDWQLSANETAEYQKHDAKEARQLLEAASWDFNQEYEITQRQDSTNQLAAEIFQRQAAEVGVKLRPQMYAFGEWLPNLMGNRRYQIVIELSPADETPGRPIRFQHSTTNNQNSGFGLHDPAIDALIEKSEETLDRAENIKLVKQIQLEAMKKYPGSRHVTTPNWVQLLSDKLQDWPVTALYSAVDPRTEAWLKA